MYIYLYECVCLHVLTSEAQLCPTRLDEPFENDMLSVRYKCGIFGAWKRPGGGQIECI